MSNSSSFEQPEMFLYDSVTDSVIIPEMLSPQPLGVGEHVNVRERTVHLHNALGALASMSSSHGFQKSVHTNEGYKKAADKYEEALPGVIEGTAKTIDQKRRVFKNEFTAAYGNQKYKNAKPISEAESIMERHDQRLKFERTYADAIGRKRRDAYKAKLGKLLEDPTYGRKM